MDQITVHIPWYTEERPATPPRDVVQVGDIALDTETLWVPVGREPPLLYNVSKRLVDEVP